MGLKWLDFLIRPLHLIGMWSGEDQRSKHQKDTCLNEIGQHLQKLPSNHSTSNSEDNWEDLCI